MPSGLKTKNDRASNIPVRVGSGNVFADVGIPNPELALAKARLVQRIRKLIATRKLTEALAAETLGLRLDQLASLQRGEVGSMTLDRLFRFLTALGQRVEISVHPA